MDVAGIASLSMAMSQSKLMQDIGTAALDMTLENAVSQGQVSAQMMEVSVYPELGQNIDISV